MLRSSAAAGANSPMNTYKLVLSPQGVPDPHWTGVDFVHPWGQRRDRPDIQPPETASARSCRDAPAVTTPSLGLFGTTNNTAAAATRAAPLGADPAESGGHAGGE